MIIKMLKEVQRRLDEQSEKKFLRRVRKYKEEQNRGEGYKN